MIDRRAFLRRLGVGTVAAAAAAIGVLDVEKLLWVPGEKTIFIPPPPTIAPLGISLIRGDVFTIEGVYAVNPLTYKTLPLLQRFVITADVTAGRPLMERDVIPRLLTGGPYQTVSASPVRESKIDGRLIKPLMWGEVLAETTHSG